MPARPTTATARSERSGCQNATVAPKVVTCISQYQNVLSNSAHRAQACARTRTPRSGRRVQSGQVASTPRARPQPPSASTGAAVSASAMCCVIREEERNTEIAEVRRNSIIPHAYELYCGTIDGFHEHIDTLLRNNPEMLKKALECVFDSLAKRK